jgi:hypothetical protein
MLPKSYALDCGSAGAGFGACRRSGALIWAFLIDPEKSVVEDMVTPACA